MLGPMGARWPIVALGVFASVAACKGASLEFTEARERMVRTQIEGRGVREPRVLAALRAVERHRFVPEDLWSSAYDDGPLPIGHGQTISQPYIVAVMTELLAPEPGDVVLDVGTGSGYQAAVLAKLVKRVYSIEIVPELAAEARALPELGERLDDQLVFDALPRLGGDAERDAAQQEALGLEASHAVGDLIHARALDHQVLARAPAHDLAAVVDGLGLVRAARDHELGRLLREAERLVHAPVHPARERRGVVALLVDAERGGHPVVGHLARSLDAEAHLILRRVRLGGRGRQARAHEREREETRSEHHTPLSSAGG